ncbi:hypothetical protein NPIL_92101 [Nephila pilipes]|uniref:Uncharacterized protein n=1 Tax=Nephila pilipes TaxID=299642 RepID=A0A8X6TU99_NEPPI|nr:hypothetical protein NPIL_92101 [Nephila pilipes]
MKTNLLFRSISHFLSRNVRASPAFVWSPKQEASVFATVTLQFYAIIYLSRNGITVSCGRSPGAFASSRETKRCAVEEGEFEPGF